MKKAGKAKLTKSKPAPKANAKRRAIGPAARKAVGKPSKTSRSSSRPPAANPYGGGPNTGITLPPDYRPTPSVKNANTFFPGVETLGADEMRISFVGSSPVPPTRAQAGTAIMVLLGNVPDLEATAMTESMIRLAKEFGPIYRLQSPRHRFPLPRRVDRLGTAGCCESTCSLQ